MVSLVSLFSVVVGGRRGGLSLLLLYSFQKVHQIKVAAVA